MACYPGPNPIDQNDPTGLRRAAVWKWVKEHGIDHGLPLDKIHDMVNHQFYHGMATGKPEWINDVLSGRKTPYREIAKEVWKKQYNRRQTILQAQDQLREGATPGWLKTARKVYGVPRWFSVLAHGVVFPVTHGGDLAFRPASWGVFWRGLMNTWSKSGSAEKTERLIDTMKRQPRFDTALRSGLDVGDRAHRSDLVNPNKKGSQSERAWSILSAMRFELWDKAMEKHTTPSMTERETVEIGKHLAEWANHATGSAKGPISNLGGDVLFGPKLTQSKLNRMLVDPVKTIKTFANWDNASAGEKIAARTRLHGFMQYLGTYMGMLAANQGLLMAMGSKQNVNFTDPKKGDFLAFKGGGMEWSIPGMHSELKTLGQILAVTFGSSKDVKAHGKSKHALLAEILGQYGMSKVNPGVGMVKELATQQDFRGRQLPQYPFPNVDTGKAKKGKEPILWHEYALSHGPIFLQGPVKYVYDQFRSKGMSALESTTLIKSIILGGIGYRGVHISEDYDAAKEEQKRDHAAAALKSR